MIMYNMNNINCSINNAVIKCVLNATNITATNTPLDHCRLQPALWNCSTDVYHVTDNRDNRDNDC